MEQIREGDLVELTETPSGYYHSLERTYGIGKGKIGVVTRVVNNTMSPALVEVTWSNGTTLKYYSDDLIPLKGKKE